MALNWQELLRSSPHELRISGPKHSSQIEEEKGLNDIVYRMYSLNFMEVSKTTLYAISDRIKELENLTALMLYDNKLTSIPKEIGRLKKLKTLDISNNQIKILPSELGQLSELQSFNMINNQISLLPKDLSKWSNLIVIKFSHNNFEQFPASLCNPALKQHLLEIHGTNNKIANIPDEIGQLSALKVFDLSNNKISMVPGELADCSKIKTLSLQGNPIKDNRLLKLVERNPAKQIMQYIAKNNARGSGAAKKPSANNNNSAESGSGDDDAVELTATKQTEPAIVAAPPPPRRKNEPALIGTIEILAVAPDNWFIINAESAILEDRKIVACIVRNLNLLDEKVLKKFISLQTTIHDTVCGRRELSTIATHDLSKVAPRIKLTKMLPHRIRIEPLNRGGKVMSGSELYKTLNQEAEAYRKEKKRSNYSGIHRYLYLLKDKTHYPVVVDANNVVITLPPLTNGESTKVKLIFFIVTSILLSIES